MPEHNQPLEMHLHGDVPIRENATQAEIEAALSPLLVYTTNHRTGQGTRSLYAEEPGIHLTDTDQMLHFCWSVAGDVDFRETLDELVMGLNDIAREGAALEVSFYDLEYEDEDWDEEHAALSAEDADQDDSRDDFFVLFVGPTPAAIMQVQRDLLVRDVTMLMARHFEEGEMTPVIKAIDHMWETRLRDLVSALSFPNHAKGSPNNNLGLNGSHGFGTHGGRKSRHSPH